MKSGNRLAAAMVAIATLPAQADPMSGTDWTGFYVGGQVGSLDVEYPTSVASIPGGILNDGSGSSVGIHVGYNQDFGALVLGAEFSLDFPSVDLELTPTGASIPREIEQLAMLKAKAGYDAGRFLPYALIGYAKQEYEDTSGLSSNVTFEGMSYGLGVSYLAGPNLIAGIEAIWFDLDPKDPGSSLTSEGTSLSLRLSYKF